MDINLWAVALCSITGFIFSMIWYSIFGSQMAKLHKAYAGAHQPKPWQIAIEFARNITVSIVIATVFHYIGVLDWIAGVEFAVILWIGFPVVLLSGSVLWEHVHPKLAMFHAGDWLLKLMLFSVILASWR